MLSFDMTTLILSIYVIFIMNHSITYDGTSHIISNYISDNYYIICLLSSDI